MVQRRAYFGNINQTWLASVTKWWTDRQTDGHSKCRASLRCSSKNERSEASVLSTLTLRLTLSQRTTGVDIAFDFRHTLGLASESRTIYSKRRTLHRQTLWDGRRGCPLSSAIYRVSGINVISVWRGSRKPDSCLSLWTQKRRSNWFSAK